MRKSEAAALIETIKGFIEGENDPPRQASAGVINVPAGKEVTVGPFKVGKGNGETKDQKSPPELNPAGGISGLTAEQVEKLYQAFKARLIDEAQYDPVLLQLLTVRPELVVGYERKTFALEGSGLKARAARLLAAGWFDERRERVEVRRELARIGADPGGGGGLTTALSELLRDGFLVREGDGWQRAPGIKVSEREIAT